MKSMVALQFPYHLPFLKFREANGALIVRTRGNFLGESDGRILLLDQFQKLRRRNYALVGVRSQTEDGANESNAFEK